MTLQVIGLRHQTASLDLREPLAFTAEQTEVALRSLKQVPQLQGVVILSTCNRTEFYLSTTNPARSLKSLALWLQQTKGLQWSDYRKALFIYQNADAVRHLFRVAAGLNSLIVGEGQILGQVKEALRLAQGQSSLDITLDRLLKAAIVAGKGVRTETGIAERDASVSQAAYAFAKAHRKEAWANDTFAVIGGGKMASLLLERLCHDLPASQRQRVCIVNRSPNRLDELCQRFGFTGVTWEAVPEVLAASSVVFVATGAPHYVLFEKDFKALSPLSQQRLLVDISVPRNIAPEVGALPNVALFNTDDLLGYHGLNVESEAEVLAHAEQLVLDACQMFQQWQETLPLQQELARVRQHMERLLQQEVQQGSGLTQDLEALEGFSRGLLKKMLHAPSSFVRAWPNPLDERPGEATRLLAQWFAPLPSNPSL